ncbi:unnamed protein product [Scytosiphon promiscuus]
MMSSTTIYRSSNTGRPLQPFWGTTFVTYGRGSTPRRSIMTGFWSKICVSLLLTLDELSPVLAKPDAFGYGQSDSDKVLPAITNNATCTDWAAWIPRSKPAVVMQVVSEDYIPIEQNFIRLMERNSAFNRHNLYLMCMDDTSKSFFEEQMGFRCVPISALSLPNHRQIWKLRVHVLSCLVRVGRVDVIISDADALWVNDPTPELFHSINSVSDDCGGSSPDGDNTDSMLSVVHAVGGSDDSAGRQEGSSWLDIRDSDVVASRGSFPKFLGEEWGSTICMGFVLFRARNVAEMATFLITMEELVEEKEDDQISVNRAAADLGITWKKHSDMRYKESTSYGVGEIPADSIAAAAAGRGANSSTRVGTAFEHGYEEGHPLKVTLLPQSTYTRACGEFPISDRTVVAHCFTSKVASQKTFWMKKKKLWSVENDP